MHFVILLCAAATQLFEIGSAIGYVATMHLCVHSQSRLLSGVGRTRLSFINARAYYYYHYYYICKYG
jgi:hypothetical protein